MKECRNCKTLKPPESFGRYARNRDGLKSYCKPCENLRISENRRKPDIHERRRAYDRQRNQDAAVKKAVAARRTTPQGKAMQRAWAAAYRDKKPFVAAAHRAVRNAIRSGALNRLPCQVCGAQSEAHHPDYSAPLSVVWLCKRHHIDAHAVSGRQDQHESD